MLKRQFVIMICFVFLSALCCIPPTAGLAQSKVATINSLAEGAEAPLFTLIRRGKGRNNVVQSHAFDSQSKLIYSLNATKNGDGEKAGVINRYAMDKTETVAMDFSLPSDQIGHQGLAAEQSPGSEGRLWASASKDGEGTSVVRFKYVPGSNIQDVQRFKVFNSGKSDSPTPTICVGDKYLVVKQNSWSRKKDARTNYTIRIFDISALKAGGTGDYSNKFTYEWNAGSEAVALQEDQGYRPPLQSLACDGKNVYILYGTASGEHRNIVSAYTLDGHLIGANDDVETGKKQAEADGSDTYYESESLSYLPTGSGPTLTYGVASGLPKQRVYRIYQVNDLRLKH